MTPRVQRRKRRQRQRRQWDSRLHKRRTRAAFRSLVRIVASAAFGPPPSIEAGDTVFFANNWTGELIAWETPTLPNAS